MTNGFDSYNDIVESLCDGFITAVNDDLPEKTELLCNQDGYDILTNALGNDFSKKDIKTLTPKQLNTIAHELSKFIDHIYSPQKIQQFIACALVQSFGSL